MQTENNHTIATVKTVNAKDFALALISVCSSITADLQDVKVTVSGDTITAIIEDALITITPREPQEGGESCK